MEAVASFPRGHGKAKRKGKMNTPLCTLDGVAVCCYIICFPVSLASLPSSGALFG